MPWVADYEGEFPTLGWGMLDWCSAYLGQPETLPEHGSYAPPLVLTREQAEFVLRLFEVHPITGAQLVRRGVLSRPRGWG